MSSFVKMEAGEKVERVEKGKEGSEPEGFQPQHQLSGHYKPIWPILRIRKKNMSFDVFYHHVVIF